MGSQTASSATTSTSTLRVTRPRTGGWQAASGSLETPTSSSPSTSSSTTSPARRSLICVWNISATMCPPPPPTSQACDSSFMVVEVFNVLSSYIFYQQEKIQQQFRSLICVWNISATTLPPPRGLGTSSGDKPAASFVI